MNNCHQEQRRQKPWQKMLQNAKSTKSQWFFPQSAFLEAGRIETDAQFVNITRNTKKVLFNLEEEENRQRKQGIKNTDNKMPSLTEHANSI